MHLLSMSIKLVERLSFIFCNALLFDCYFFVLDELSTSDLNLPNLWYIVYQVVGCAY